MTTINAATIYAELMARAACAPETSAAHDAPGARAIRQTIYFESQAPGLANDGHDTAEDDPDPVRHARTWAARAWQISDAEAEALGELIAHAPDKFATISTGERSRVRILNTRERLTAFAETVRKNQALYGGGIVKTAKPRPSVRWPATSVKVIWELLQDGNAAAAQQMAEEKAGARYVNHQLTYQTGKRPCMIWAPVPVTGLPDGFASARRDDGKWIVMHQDSGLAVHVNGRNSRKSAEDDAREAWANANEAQRANSLANAAAQKNDQAAARLAWMIHNSIPADDATDLHQAAAQDETAADQVRSVIASATAAAAIEQASTSAADAHQAQDDTHEARELETVGADASEASATQCAAAGHSAAQPAQQGHASASTHQAPARAGSTAPITRQTVASKSGRWAATLYTDDDGKPAMHYTGPDGTRNTTRHASTRERMQTLQTLAREADATPTPQPEAATPGGYASPAGNLDRQNSPVPSLADKVPRDLETFQRQQPAGCDLRHLIAAGLAVKDLVGLGVICRGDYCNPQTVGAIVEADTVGGTVITMSRGNAHKFPGMPNIRVTIITEDGVTLNAWHDDFDQDRHSARYLLDYKRHGAPYMAQLQAARATAKANREAAQTAAALAREQERQRLAEEFPQLQRAASTHEGGKLAAINIRKLLKARFPGVKFSVHSSYSSVKVGWTDGPTDAEVNEVISRFDIGASDLQTDYFYTVSSAWSDIFGGVQYLSTNRHHSDELITKTLALYWLENGDSSTPAPSVTDWREAKGVFDYHGSSYHLQTFRKLLTSTSAAA